MITIHLKLITLTLFFGQKTKNTNGGLNLTFTETHSIWSWNPDLKGFGVVLSAAGEYGIQTVRFRSEEVF